MLFSWEALCLIEHLTTWGEAWLARETLLSNWGVPLSVWKAWEALSLVEHLTACLPDWVETKLVPAWGETKLLPDWGLFPSWERPSLEGMLIGGVHWLPGKLCCPGEGWCLPACKDLAITLVDCKVSQVIFPSFLYNKLLNLFTCLFLTLFNLNSPTFSKKNLAFPKVGSWQNRC